MDIDDEDVGLYTVNHKKRDILIIFIHRNTIGSTQIEK